MLSTIHLLALASARHRGRRVFVVAAGVCLAAALASCGGGGGGGAGGGGPTSQQPPPVACPAWSADDEAPSRRECTPKPWAQQFSDAPQPAAVSIMEAEAEKTSQFQAQWGLGAINAHWAYARGATGTGVTLGVLDGGMDHYHSRLANQFNREKSRFLTQHDVILPPGPDPGPGPLRLIRPGETHADYLDDYRTNRSPPLLGYPKLEDGNPVATMAENGFYWQIPQLGGISIEHGTATAGIVAGEKVANEDDDDAFPHGVAYDAIVQFFATLTSEPQDPFYAPDTFASLAGTAKFYSDRLIGFVEDGVSAVNISLGVPGLTSDPFYLTPVTDSNGFRLTLRSEISSFGDDENTLFRTMSQEDKNPGDRTIFVWAAGNSHNPGESICKMNLGTADDPISNHRCNAADPDDPDRTPEILQDKLDNDPFSLPADDPDRMNAGFLDPDSPDILAGLPWHFPEFRGHVLAAAGIQRDDPATPDVNEGTIAFFSNPCGELPDDWLPSHGRHYCLAAPGSDIPTLQAGQESAEPRSGTSFSAPHVVGAIGVLIDFFTDGDEVQHVGNTAIVQRMLDTANRKGIYSEGCDGTVTGTGNDRECDTYSTIYGAGLLDLKAATEPVGMTTAMVGASLDGPSLPFAGTRLSAGPAYGDAFTRAFADTRVAAFDSMLFPFWHPLTSLVESPSRRDINYHRARFSPARRVSADLPGIGVLRLGIETLSPAPRHSFRPDADALPRRRPSSLAFRRETGDTTVFAAWRAPDTTPFALRETLPTPLSGDAFDHPFLAFAGDGITAGMRVGALTAAAFTDPNAPSPVHGMALDYALSPYVSAQAGMLNEKGGALGLRPDGAFGSLTTTTTAFTGLELDAPVAPRWRLLAHAHLGTARPDVGGVGLVKRVSPMVASAISVGIAGYGILTEADSLTLALSQPLRVERGRVSLVVPTGRTPGGDLRRAAVDAGLEPSGREVAVSAAWTATVGQAAYVRLAAGASREPGHDESADNAFHALADVSFRF